MKRVDYLDGLRGLAAVLVMVHHLMIGFFPSTYTQDPNTIHTQNEIEFTSHNYPVGIIINGGFAVAIFLVLSGYVVGLKENKRISIAELAETVVKRFFRFFVPILLTHLIALSLIKLGWYWNKEAAVITGSSWWLARMWQMNASITEAIGQAFTVLVTIKPLDQVYNSSTWTMPYFFWGPIGLLVVMFLFQAKWLRNLILLLATIAVLKTNYWPIGLGYFLGIFWNRLPTKISLVTKMVIGALIVVLGNYPQAYQTASGSLYRILPQFGFTHTSTFYHTMATLLLLILLRTSSWWQKVLGSKIMLFLGKISFSIYLTHILIINSITSGLFVRFYEQMSYSRAFAAALMISIPIIGLTSGILYQLAEQPAIKLSRSVLQWCHGNLKITTKK